MRLSPRNLLLSLCALPVVAGLVLGLAGGAALLLAVDSAPTVALAAEPALADIARANALLHQHDPRRALPGITRAAALSQRDLGLLLGQAARRAGMAPRAHVALGDGHADLRASLPLSRAWPALGAGRWLNVTARLQQTDGLPQLDSLRIGRLPVPAWLAEGLLPTALQAMGLKPQGELALEMVNRVAFTPQRAVVAFAWPDNLEQRLADTLVPPLEQARLKVYAERLAGLTQELRAELGPRSAVPLPRLLQPMFALAQQQSLRSRQPAKENRAALLVLASLVSGRGLHALVPSASRWPRQRPLAITLAGRTDTPQHYLVSAALAVEGGGPLSDAIGLYKEVADARGGSGFSFNDLAADRAGTRFGLLATQAPETLQARLAAGVQELDLLPAITDLPEDMQTPEFQLRFGGVGAPAYLRVMADIETRLDRLPLLSLPLLARRP